MQLWEANWETLLTPENILTVTRGGGGWRGWWGLRTHWSWGALSDRWKCWVTVLHTWNYVLHVNNTGIKIKILIKIKYTPQFNGCQYITELDNHHQHLIIEHFYPEGGCVPISHPSPHPQTLDNHPSTFCFYGFDPLGCLIKGDYVIWCLLCLAQKKTCVSSQFTLWMAEWYSVAQIQHR